MQTLTNQQISNTMTIVMAGITKVYIGELIETGTFSTCFRRERTVSEVMAARSVMSEWNETGPIHPRHIREAYRRMKNHNKAPPNTKFTKRRLFAR
jgi:transcription initiation factor TFIID subunit 11